MPNEPSSTPTGGDASSSNRRRFLKVAGALGVSALAGCSGDGDSNAAETTTETTGGTATETSTPALDDLSPEEWRKEMAARAKEELSGGEKINWVTAIRSAEIVNTWTAGFEEEYPELEGTLNAIQGRTSELRERMIREAQAGNLTTDLTDANMLPTLDETAFADLTGIPSYDNMDDGLKLESNQMGAYGFLPYMPAYNTELVDDPPQTYDDMLNDKWKGEKIVMDYTPNPMKVSYILTTKGEDWVRQFGELPPRMITSGAKVTQVVANGNNHMNLFAIGPHISRHAGKGKPIKPIMSEELWVWSVKKVFMPGAEGKQPHPAGAKVLADFLMRQDNADLQSTRTGQLALDGETIASEVSEWADLYNGPEDVPNPIKQAEELDIPFDKLQKRYRELVGAPSV